jgi:hypothetical protein
MLTVLGSVLVAVVTLRSRGRTAVISLELRSVE